MSERVSFELDERGVARLRLIRPDASNAIDPAMVAELGQAIEACRGPLVRSVLISAAGPAFTVGGDLRHLAAHTDDLHGALAAIVGEYHAALGALATIEAPVVAAVQGAIAGGGLGLAWCSDMVIAARGTRFATGFARLGLSGDGGSSWWLPRLVGLRRAQEMLLAGRVLDAEEALEWGLISEVVPAGELASRSEAVALQVACGPAVALGHMRRLLRTAPTHGLEEHLAEEAAAMLDCAQTPDAVEGINAFMQKRAPNFR